jgi:ABC transporter substrate binding protein
MWQEAADGSVASGGIRKVDPCGESSGLNRGRIDLYVRGWDGETRGDPLHHAGSRAARPYRSRAEFGEAYMDGVVVVENDDESRRRQDRRSHSGHEIHRRLGRHPHVISDPVAAGFVASLPRPGGNLTGLMQFEASITGKWLAMLKEIAPRLARAALVKNTKTNDYEHFMRAAEGVAPSLAIELVSSHVEKPADIARAIESLARVPDGGLVVLPDPTTLVHRDLIIALAARYRLPAVYSGRHFVVAGGLMSYGINRVDEFRQAASYVDRILRGDKPADLPVLAPTKYETVVSLKVAKIIGLEVPPTLLVRADEVIE